MANPSLRPLRLLLFSVGLAVVMYTAAYHSYYSVSYSRSVSSTALALLTVGTEVEVDNTHHTDAPVHVPTTTQSNQQVESLKHQVELLQEQVQQQKQEMLIMKQQLTQHLNHSQSDTKSSSETTSEARHQQDGAKVREFLHAKNKLSHTSNSNTNATHTKSSPATASSQTPIRKLKPHELKLPTPIIVMGLQKAGTTSIYSYFTCGMQGKLSHYDCKPPKHPTRPDQYGMSCGKKMLLNKERLSQPLFYEMDDWDLYAEIDAPHNNPRRGVLLPQWEWIQDIHERFPNATWILNYRNPAKWLSSIDRWKDLRQRFVNTHYPPHFPRGKGKTDQEMMDFYNLQAERVVNFTKAHPSHHHHLVRVTIDSPNAGEVLEEAFGITRQCWGNKNHNKGDALWTPN